MMSLTPPSSSSAKQKNRQDQEQSEYLPKSTENRVFSFGGFGGRIERAMQSLEKNIWLPDTPATFAFYFVAIVVLCGGLFLHINLSAQITRTQYDIAAMQRNYYETERESAEIVSQIALATSMFDIYERATRLGYVPVTDKSKNFVAAADIRVPSPEVASSATDSGINNNKPAAITLAEALEAQSVTVAGFIEPRVSESDSNNAMALDRGNVDDFSTGNGIDLMQGNESNINNSSFTSSLTTQLINWWKSD